MEIATSAASDTLTVRFDAAVPPYRMSVNPSGVQFTGGGGKDETFVLEGTAGMRLDITNLDWTEPPGNQFSHGTDLRQTAPLLLEARQIGNFEGVVNIALGLRRPSCPAIATTSGSTQLVLTFAHG